jgi:hypothetical protein
VRSRAALPLFGAAVVGATAMLCCVLSASIASAKAGDPPRRDEFGLIPDDATDKDLTLPDPVLDRTWPGPAPGDADAHPSHVEPDEDKTDPFHDKDAPAPPPRGGDADRGGDEKAPSRAPAPLGGPDGKRDIGSPVPEPDPDLPDVLERNDTGSSDMEKEDSEPSPLDQDDRQYKQETEDPEE